MIAKAIKEEHPRARPLHITVEHFEEKLLSRDIGRCACRR
jgi:hypothetical protein